MGMTSTKEILEIDIGGTIFGHVKYFLFDMNDLYSPVLGEENVLLKSAFERIFNVM